MVENRHLQAGLSDEKVLEMYKVMLLARRIDERMWLLNRSGKIPFVVSCQGQEAAQVGAAFALNREKDYVLPYYRDLGVVLAFGMTAKDLMLSSFAKAEDPNSGGVKCLAISGKKESHRDGFIACYNSSTTCGWNCTSCKNGRERYRFICYFWRRFI